MTRIGGRTLLRDAHTHRYAIPAFNVSNLETTQAIIAAAEAAAAPVILQLSPGAIAYAGYRPLRRLVFDLAEDATVPIVVHLDHCRDADGRGACHRRRLRFGHVRRLAPAVR